MPDDLAGHRLTRAEGLVQCESTLNTLRADYMTLIQLNNQSQETSPYNREKIDCFSLGSHFNFKPCEFGYKSNTCNMGWLVGALYQLLWVI